MYQVKVKAMVNNCEVDQTDYNVADNSTDEVITLNYIFKKISTYNINNQFNMNFKVFNAYYDDYGTSCSTFRDLHL